MAQAYEFIIGDVHGHSDLLKRLVDKCRGIAAERGAEARIFTLGDYVDRGPDSRGVIEYLMADDSITCLRGNHEEMMFRAALRHGGWFAEPGGDLAHWLDNGGVPTLLSYSNRVTPSQPGWDEFVQDFLNGDVVPEKHLKWGMTLPTMHKTKYRLMVHAGLMPGFEPELQNDETLLWIRTKFLQANANDFPGLEGRYIVHGHTPKWAGKPDESMPEVLEHRCNIDCGPMRTGFLRAAMFDADVAGKPEAIVSVDDGR